MIDRATAQEIQTLLDEAEYWVREHILPSEWRDCSRIYDTRGAFLAASKKVQGRIEKALLQPVQAEEIR